jgi:mannosidase alpha-like ER degradation enhancer 2
VKLPALLVKLVRPAMAAAVCAMVAGAALAAAPRSAPSGGGPGGTAGTFGKRERAALAARVRAETLFSWRNYERYAWGHDELRPRSRTVRDWYAAPLLMTPVDALDTLLLMGLGEEAAKAKELIVRRLSFDQDIPVKNFEITIRLLGGLLSSYQMTGDARLLRLADDLGTRLLPVFASPTGMPYTFVNLRTGKATGARSNPAEIGTLLLEFGTLSRLTGKAVFYDKAKRALVALYGRRSRIGLVGEEIDVESGAWTRRASHVGGGIDSYYEYLFKCWRLFGDADCGRMWKASLGAVNRYLADEAPSGFWYGEADMLTGARTASEFGALHAFWPAVLALGGDLGRARRLEDSCFKMWNLRGIEPEVIDYRAMRVLAAGYPLRPEIMESAYYLRRLTHEPRYLEMSRTFLAALTARCRTPSGYTVLKSVETGEQGDLMPSYFLAETLKYLYLTFAPDGALDFDHVIFNTEGHPLRPVR